MDHISMAKNALRSSETYIANSGELQNHCPTKKKHKPDTVDGSEIRHPPVEGKVVEIPLFH